MVVAFKINVPSNFRETTKGISSISLTRLLDLHLIFLL